MKIQFVCVFVLEFYDEGFFLLRVKTLVVSDSCIESEFVVRC